MELNVVDALFVTSDYDDTLEEIVAVEHVEPSDHVEPDNENEPDPEPMDLDLDLVILTTFEEQDKAFDDEFWDPEHDERDSLMTISMALMAYVDHFMFDWIWIYI